MRNCNCYYGQTGELISRCLQCSSAHSSACSGADARTADKAIFDQGATGSSTAYASYRAFLAAEAAVSPRSSDGPACPLCHEVMRYEGGYGFGGYAETERYECETCYAKLEVRSKSWSLAQEARAKAK